MLDATDIVDLVGEHVALTPKGREFVCLCPFHDDHKPSMYVVPNKQIYHCFSCGAGGNAFDFVMNYHGMGFVEALRLLAERAGIELTPRRPDRSGSECAACGDAAVDGGEAGVSRAAIAAANELAVSFFRAVLRHGEHGSAARAMIERRGIPAEQAEAFALGAAPARWDGLVQTAATRGVGTETLEAAGLVKRRAQGGGHYDAFRHRLVFPILDQGGRTVAFGGRRLDDEDEPKYLNSPETALFRKSAVLYGLRQAARAIQQARRVVVTEGYTDVIACHAAGHRNVVATLGTALTPEHARILGRMCDEVIVLFDGDEAGQRAADRAFDALFPLERDVRVATLPGGRDPDDLLREAGGAEAFGAVLDGAEDAIGWLARRRRDALIADGWGRDSAAWARVLDETLARVVGLGLLGQSPERQGQVRRTIGRAFGIDAARLREALERHAGSRRRQATGDEAAPAALAAPTRPVTPAEHALACLLADDGGVLPGVDAELFGSFRIPEASAAYSSPQGYALGLACVAHLARGESPALASVLLDQQDGAVRAAATAFASHVRRATEDDEDRLVRLWRDCCRRLALAEDPGGAEADALARLRAAQDRQRRLGPTPWARPTPVT